MRCQLQRVGKIRSTGSNAVFIRGNNRLPVLEIHPHRIVKQFCASQSDSAAYGLIGLQEALTRYIGYGSVPQIDLLCAPGRRSLWGQISSRSCLAAAKQCKLETERLPLLVLEIAGVIPPFDTMVRVNTVILWIDEVAGPVDYGITIWFTCTYVIWCSKKRVNSNKKKETS